MLINVLLAGDNAVVIVLLCRNLPEGQRKWGIACGMAGAIVLRVLLMGFAMALLAMPYLKIVCALLLVWTAVQILTPDGDTNSAGDSPRQFWATIKTVMAVDFVMSFDHVLAIAGAAQNAQAQYQLHLVLLGLLLSIPVIVAGSQRVLQFTERWPVLVTLTAMLLGWIAGQMVYSDDALNDVRPQGQVWILSFGFAGAWLVWVISRALLSREQN